MKVGYLLCTVAFLLSFNNGFAEKNEGRIVKPPTHTESEGRIRRRVAPKDEKVGVSGKLEWKKDKDDFEYLAITTTSGKSYELISKDQALQKKLADLTGKEGRQVEVSGTVTKEGGDKLKVQSIETEDIDNDGEYIVGYNKTLSSAQIKRLVETFETMPNTKFVGGDGESNFVVKSDFSQKHMEQIAKDAGVGSSIRYIEPNAKRQALGGLGIEL